MNSDFKDLLNIFNAYHVRYLIIGGYAVMKYTEPRYTKDLDIWVNPSIENAGKVYIALKNFGAPLNNISLDDFTDPDLIYQIGIAPNRSDMLMGIAGMDKAFGMSVWATCLL